MMARTATNAAYRSSHLRTSPRRRRPSSKSASSPFTTKRSRRRFLASAAISALASTSGGANAFATGSNSGQTTSKYFSSKKSMSKKPPPPLLSKQSPKAVVTESKQPERTQSFEPVWEGSLGSHLQTTIDCDDSDTNIEVHTLILGTHPSIASLSEAQYFGHTQNAFWWIVGDCLGFRRKSGFNPQGKPYKLAEHLRYEEIIPYDQQVKVLTSKGFALWDIVKACERKGSLDQDITNDEPNDIRGFCQQHPTIKRIVLANGGTGCAKFNKHFKDWWLSGELKPGSNDESEKAFRKFAKHTNDFREGTIEIISALPVSPAAAKYTYPQKRDSWDDLVYKPGLRDHEELSGVDATENQYNG